MIEFIDNKDKFYRCKDVRKKDIFILYSGFEGHAKSKRIIVAYDGKTLASI